MQVQLGSTTLAGTFNYYQDGSNRPVVDHSRAIDINGDGIDEVLFYGHETQPNTSTDYSNTNLALFGWVDGKFVNITQQWLPGTSYQVGGVNDVALGDFNGDGRLDIFLSGYTDMNHPVGVYALMNQGTYFEKVHLGDQPWQHGAASVDFNGDGYTDVMTTGYGKSPALYLGSSTGLKYHQFSWGGGSDVVFGDFLNNGTVTAILTDHGRQPNNADIVLVRYFTDGEGSLAARILNHLPIPFFETQPYDLVAGAQRSHDVSAVSVDFNNDGLLDVITLSTVQDAGDTTYNGRELADFSEIQFFANRGGGNFEDVTAVTRTNHDQFFHPSYAPLARDFNGDGLVDLWTNRLYLQNDQSQFVGVGNDLFRAAVTDTGTLALGPDGNFYLVTSQDQQGVATVSVAKIEFGSGSTLTTTAVSPGQDTGTPVVDIEDDSVEAQIIRLYDAAFDRSPDQSGFDYWVDQMQSGMPLVEVSESFIGSTEFELLYGTDPSDDVFVTNLYNNVLDRAPDAAGLDWWTNSLVQGMPRSNVLLGFSESAEYIDLMQLQIDLVAASMYVDPWGGG